MGRHSLPDDYIAGGTRPPSRVRRRTLAIAAVLVLGIVASAGVAVQRGLFGLANSCEDSAVKLRLAASPDIAPAIRGIADRAREDRVTSDGSCMDVAVTERDSRKVADALGTHSAKPDYAIWVPDSQAWVDRASATGDSVPLTSANSVAVSPVLMAMVPSAANTLGWPAKTYTWAELTAAATDSDTIHLGAADPAHSATGLLALSSIAKSAGKGADSETQVAATAKLLSRRVSEGDAQVLDTLARDDSGGAEDSAGHNQAVILSEQAAFTHNTVPGSTQQLQLFYPEDGAPELDYPYTVVDEAALTTDESRAATRFMTYLGESTSRRILEQHGFRAPGAPADASRVKTAGGLSPQPYAKCCRYRLPRRTSKRPSACGRSPCRAPG